MEQRDTRPGTSYTHGTMLTKPLSLFPLLFAMLGLPLALGIVPPNGVYGVRTASTLASPKVWYSANLSAGITAVLLGAAGTAFLAVLSRRASIPVGAKIVAAVATTIFVAI